MSSSPPPLVIGVLALQGAFLEHAAAFRSLGVAAREVRTPADLAGLDGLVLPGGESTAIGVLAGGASGLLPALRAWVAGGRPTWGTCAGMIMLADGAEGAVNNQPLLGGLRVVVARNFFGAQTRSFEAPLELAPGAAGLAARLPGGAATGVFIRAPAIVSCGEGVTPLAWVVPPPGARGEGTRVAVAAEAGPVLVAAFHPELTPSTGWHAYFLDKVAAAAGRAPLPGGAAHAASAERAGAGGGAPLAGALVPDTYAGDTPASAHAAVELARRVVPGAAPWAARA